MGKQEVPGQGWSFIGTDPEGSVLALWEAKMQPRLVLRRQTKGKKRNRKIGAELSHGTTNHSVIAER